MARTGSSAFDAAFAKLLWPLSSCRTLNSLDATALACSIPDIYFYVIINCVAFKNGGNVILSLRKRYNYASEMAKDQFRQPCTLACTDWDIRRVYEQLRGALLLLLSLSGICNTSNLEYTHTHTRLTALFRDYPAEPVPEK